MINKNNLLSYILCNANLKLPISNSHYLSSKNLITFKNFTSIEKNLTCVTDGLKGFYNNLFNK